MNKVEWKIIMENKESKENDDENVDKAFSLVYELIEKNTYIEANLWVCSMFSAIVSIHKKNDLNYETFLYNIKKACEHFKSVWDE